MGCIVAGARAAAATRLHMSPRRDCCASKFAGGRVLYALSVALPELPAASAAILTAAANGDRAAAETVAEAARRSVTVDLAGDRCRTGRVRIGGGGANETRATIEVDFTCGASHGRLDIAEDWSAFLGEHYQTLGNLRTPSGERQVTFGEASRTASVDIDRTAATGWFDFVRARCRAHPHRLRPSAVPGCAARHRARRVVGGAHRHGFHAGSQRDVVGRRRWAL